MFFNFNLNLSSSKILGLDLGSDSIKACSLNLSSKSAKLESINFVNTKPEAYKNGEILNAGLLKTLVAQAVQPIKSKKACVGASGSSVMVKKISIPKMDEALLPEQVRWEAEQYIPYNIEEVTLDYVTLPLDEESDSMDLILVAAQKDKIQSLVGALQGVKGLKVDIADVSSFALANAFLFNYPELKSSTVGLLDIGAFFTHFVVVHQGHIVFCRDIPSGGQNFDVELSKTLGVPESEAKSIKEAGGDMPDIAVDTIRSQAKKYSEQVKGSYEFFVETTPGLNLSAFYVTGGASLTGDLLPSLMETFGLPMEPMDLFRNIKPTSKVIDAFSDEDLRYKTAVALGLALRQKGEA